MKRHLGLVLVIGVLMALAPTASAFQEMDPIEERVALIEFSPAVRFDDFEEPYPEGFWSDETTETSERFFEDGAYHIVVHEPQTVAWGLGEGPGEDLVFENFLAATEVGLRAGPVDNQMGLIFRFVDRENFYVYRISSDGYYSLARLVDGEWESLVSWSATEAIDQEEGASNVLELLVENGSISMLINGELVDAFDDEDSYAGAIGLMAGTYTEGGVQAGFDGFAVWETDNPTAETLVRLDDIRAGEPLYSEDFEDPDPDVWRERQTTESSRFVEEGQLHVQVDADQMVSWIGPQDSEEFGDFLLEVDASQVAGPEDGEYGVIFRNADDAFYYFKVGSDGFYALDAYVNDDWESLVAWTETDALELGEGAINRLGVLANGAALTLFANDIPLVTFEDDALASGVLALAAGTAEEGGVEATFDNLRIWELTQPEPTPEPTATTAFTPTPESLATAMSAPAPETPTPTVAPTAAPDATDATDAELLVSVLHLAKPDFSDDFRRPDSGWGVSDDASATIAYADRALQFEVNRRNYITWSFNDHITELNPADFLVEVDVQHLAGPTNVGYGLFFAFQDADNYHRLFIAQSGQFALQKVVDGEGEDLIAWQPNPALDAEPEGINRLGLLVEGDTITVLANDQVLGQATDPDMEPGRLALMASTATVPGLQVAFDNFDLWVLESGSELSATPAPAGAR